VISSLLVAKKRYASCKKASNNKDMPDPTYVIDIIDEFIFKLICMLP
jgi:hypothetical protein